MRCLLAYVLFFINFSFSFKYRDSLAYRGIRAKECDSIDLRSAII